MPLMEKEVNGCMVKYDPELGRINYSIGGRIFKKLDVTYGFSTKEEPNISLKDKNCPIIEFNWTGDTETDRTRIMTEACTYAEKL